MRSLLDSVGERVVTRASAKLGTPSWSASTPSSNKPSRLVGDGRRCFSGVIEQVARYCERNGLPGDPRVIAIRLWTFVHGAASLLIDDDYAIVAPDLDVMAMIRETTPLMLSAQRRDRRR